MLLIGQDIMKNIRFATIRIYAKQSTPPFAKAESNNQSIATVKKKMQPSITFADFLISIKSNRHQYNPSFYYSVLMTAICQILQSWFSSSCGKILNIFGWDKSKCNTRNRCIFKYCHIYFQSLSFRVGLFRFGAYN